MFMTRSSNVSRNQHRRRLEQLERLRATAVTLCVSSQTPQELAPEEPVVIMRLDRAHTKPRPKLDLGQMADMSIPSSAPPAMAKPIQPRVKQENSSQYLRVDGAADWTRPRKRQPLEAAQSARESQHGPCGLDSEFRRLRAVIQEQLPEVQHAALVFSSLDQAQETAEIVAGLGVALIESGQAKVLLVDGSHSIATLSKHFGCADATGLAEVFQEELPWSDAVITTAVSRVDLLPAGRKCWPALVSSADQQWTRLIQDAQAEYDFVLIAAAGPDHPGFKPMASAADMTYMLASCETTHKSALQESLENLSVAGVGPLACILTQTGN